MKVSFKSLLVLSIVFVLFAFQLSCSAQLNAETAPSLTVDQILNKLEKRFSGKGFSADFYQESPLQDIGIIETAEGKAFFKKPEKFRWEYTTPDRLHYISDGKTLWIHSPDDNNVWLGETADFFGKESSASFLTDIGKIREKFTVTKREKKSKTGWELLLVPVHEAAFGINKIFLSVNRQTGNISKIISFNTNDTETRITLSNYTFTTIPEESLFHFTIPQNANIIPLR